MLRSFADALVDAQTVLDNRNAATLSQVCLCFNVSTKTLADVR